MGWTVAITLISAVSFGTVDFLGGIASRKDAPLVVTAFSHLASAVFLAVSVLLMRPDRFLGGAETAWALVGGLASGLGVLMLYEGFARGKMGLVSALAAAISGATPALFDLARGTHVGPATLAGLVLAVVAAVLVSASESGDDERCPAGPAVAFAIASGVSFALGILAFDALAALGSGVDGDAGQLPLFVARLFSAAVLTMVAAGRLRRVRLKREVAAATVSAGLFDAAANIALLAAIVRGPLVLVSPLQALYPIPTILLARVFLKEHVHGMQMAGMGLALVALVLTAIPA